MGDQPHFQALFETALQDYEKQTGISLPSHPLAHQFLNCDSAESVTTILDEQTQAFSEFRGKDKVKKLIQVDVLVLYKLSAIAGLGQSISSVAQVRP
jgi:hypothetical protein